MDLERAQASLEYAVVVAMVLAASIPIWMFVQGRIDTSRYELDSAISQEAVDRVTAAADWAYLSGYPARRIVEKAPQQQIVAGLLVARNQIIEGGGHGRELYRFAARLRRTMSGDFGFYRPDNSFPRQPHPATSSS